MHFKASHSHVNSSRSVWSPIRDTHLFYFRATFMASFSATFSATFGATFRVTFSVPLLVHVRTDVHIEN